MNGRQRIIHAIERKEVDKIPKDFGSTFFSTITLAAYSNLLEYLGMEELKSDIKIVNRSTQIVFPHEKILQQFEIDTRPIILGKPDSWTDKEIDDTTYEDEWHVIRTKPVSSYYYDLKTCPLSGMDRTINDINNFDWPDPTDAGLYRSIRPQIDALKIEDKYARVLSAGVGPVHLTQYLRGFEDWFMDIGLNERFFSFLMNYVAEILIERISNAFKQANGDVDVFAMGDDLGHQQGLLFSPETYRKHIKPLHKRICDIVHKHNAKMLLHTCGSIEPIINDLIDAGVDALNPVQVSAANMNCVELRKKYGENICFWGGVDTQHVMPYGKREDVKNEVFQRLHEFGKGGGYILAAVHNIQPDVPAENICELFSTDTMVNSSN